MEFENAGQMVSPRARGCCAISEAKRRGYNGFPVCAGVLPSGLWRFYRAIWFPRVRGGVAVRLDLEEVIPEVSPRARGCCSCGFQMSRVRGGFPRAAGCCDDGVQVFGESGGGFPACAGVLLLAC